MADGKKAAFLIYPMFCNWEIALTIATLKMFGKDIDVIALDDKPVTCEEGLVFLPDKAICAVNTDDYDCLLLSGIGGNPDAVIYDDAYTEFLRSFAGRGDVVLAAISLAPVLLGRAGLLNGRRFCVGMVEEDREEFGFFEYENLVRAPLVTDGNVVTAMGAGFREFAVETARKLGYECRPNMWGEIKKPIVAEDWIFHAG